MSMNKTKGIFVTAGLLLVAAVLLAWSAKPEKPGNGRRSPPRTARARPAPAPPLTPPPVTVGRVTLKATLSGDRVLHNGAGDLFLDLSLASRSSNQRDRSPVNIGLVIDRSGSMSGLKLRHAKQAAQMLVSRLQDGDRLAVVTYGSDTSLLVPSTRISSTTRPTIYRAISRIRARGQTFLSGGYNRGLVEVMRQGLQGYVNRIILISDGRANRGVRSILRLTAMARAAQSSGVATTTMGVGLSFNEDLMTAMSVHGAGHAYFIENASALAGIFTKELQTLLHTVASRATVTLTLEPGVQLLEVYGYAHEQRGRRVTIKIPDIHGSQRRKIICKLRAPTARTGNHPLVRVELAFHDPQSGRDEVVTTANRVIVTGDRLEVARGRNREVAAKVEQIAVASTMQEAVRAYGAGDRSRSQALLRTQIDATVAKNRRFRDARLGRLVGKMRRQLRRSRAARRPSSRPGRSLIKQGKYDAMDAYH
jgi:Ca-activated chloride channel family protein